MTAIRISQIEQHLVAASTKDTVIGVERVVLALFVKAIVEAHGGTIQVSPTLGRGTTFTLEMPVAER